MILQPYGSCLPDSDGDGGRHVPKAGAPADSSHAQRQTPRHHHKEGRPQVTELFRKYDVVVYWDHHGKFTWEVEL